MTVHSEDGAIELLLMAYIAESLSLPPCMARPWHGHAAHATMAPCTVNGHDEEHWPFSGLGAQVTSMVNVCIGFKSPEDES